jgi:hypothetical protein
MTVDSILSTIGGIGSAQGAKGIVRPRRRFSDEVKNADNVISAGGVEEKSTRFISGAVVIDQKSGKIYTGTIDLQPTLDRIQKDVSYPSRNDGSIFQNRPPVGGDGTPSLPVQPPG